MVLLLDTDAGGDNVITGAPAYDGSQNQQPVNTISAEEQAAREQVWKADLTKVSNLC